MTNMTIRTHEVGGVTITELVGADVLIAKGQDVLDLLSDIYTGEQIRLILHEAQLDPAFFNLRTGMAGDILQKFVNYHIKVAIVGQFEKYQSQALRDLVYEANKGRDLSFTASVSEALERLARP